MSCCDVHKRKYRDILFNDLIYEWDHNTFLTVFRLAKIGLRTSEHRNIKKVQIQLPYQFSIKKVYVFTSQKYERNRKCT